MGNNDKTDLYDALLEKLKTQFDEAGKSLSQMLSVSSAIMNLVSKAQNSISGLKEINNLLTETSKIVGHLSKANLSNLGETAFTKASKYSKKASDYLNSVQEMYKADHDNAKELAELSIAAQSACDMTIELAESMSVVGSAASSFGADIAEVTAALSTMIAATQRSGSEVAEAFKAILLNIRQVSDEDVGIDAECLIKYENACNALNVHLKETKNGILSLRDPMEVLKDLATEYNKLDESDTRKADLLSSVGNQLSATQLDELLSQWDTYEAMLKQYADGTGSVAVEAEKTANSWEGSLNCLPNTWTDTIRNIADSDAIATVINDFNSLISVVNTVTDKLGVLGNIGIDIKTFETFKDGKSIQRFCPSWM